MESRIKKLKDKYFDYSMIRWALVGSFTTIIDYSLFVYLFSQMKSVYLSNLISASVATSVNYFAHHKWTFKSKQNHSRSGGKYALNLVFWWLVSTSVIQVMVLLNIDPKIAKLFPIVLIIPINYFVLNFLVFRNKT
jgi:putative flippase GtrA